MLAGYVFYASYDDWKVTESWKLSCSGKAQVLLIFGIVFFFLLQSCCLGYFLYIHLYVYVPPFVALSGWYNWFKELL